LFYVYDLDIVAASNNIVTDTFKYDKLHNNSFLLDMLSVVKFSPGTLSITFKHYLPVELKAIKPSKGVHSVLKQSTKL
jgi:hypothetical protein